MDANPLGLNTSMSKEEQAALQTGDTVPGSEKKCTPRRQVFGAALAAALVATAVVLWIALSGRTDPEPLPPACASGCSHLNHTLWTGVLTSHVRPSSASGISYAGLDYEGVRNDARFRDYIQQIAEVDVSLLDDVERKALFINAYNALGVRLLLDECQGGLCKSIKDIGSHISPVWGMPAGQIGGPGADHLYSLDNIEHDYLRATFPDARIHAAVNCASLSCPDLAPTAFESWRLDVQLDAAAATWMANPSKGASLSGGTLSLSKIFDWYGDDFVNWAGGIITFVKAHSVAGSSLSTMGEPSLAYFDYNWDVNNVS